MSYTVRANSQNDPTPYYIAAALVFVVIVVFSTLTFRRLNQVDYSTTPKVTIDKNVPMPLPSNLISAESIKNLAATKAPDSTVDTVNLQKTNDQLVYVVDLNTGEQLKFDAKTGGQLPTQSVLTSPTTTVESKTDTLTTDTTAPTTTQPTSTTDTDSKTDKKTDKKPSKSDETPDYTTSPAN